MMCGKHFLHNLKHKPYDTDSFLRELKSFCVWLFICEISW